MWSHRKRPQLGLNALSAVREASRQQATGKEKLAITRRLYAKSHMTADVRARICMPR